MNDADLVLKILQDYYGHKWGAVDEYLLARQKFQKGKLFRTQMYQHLFNWIEHQDTADEIMQSLNREGLYVRNGL
jgi:hypothetical protein